MQAKKRETVTSGARRQQIIEAAIVVLAREGLARTSFTRIAREAGLSSPGLISYHFDDKDELLASAMGLIVDSLDAELADRLDAVADQPPTARLVAFIEAFVGYQDRHRDQVAAAWRLMAHLTVEEPLDADPAKSLPVVRQRRMVAILEAGQASGEFRDFDVRYLAHALHGALEGYYNWFVADPDVDPGHFIREMTDLALGAVRSDA